MSWGSELWSGEGREVGEITTGKKMPTSNDVCLLRSLRKDSWRASQLWVVGLFGSWG